MAEKQQELDDKTINGYKAKFAVFFEIIDKDFDVRKFSKLEVQKVKAKLIARSANETKGAAGKNMSAKTMNMYLSNYRTFFTWLKSSVNGIADNPFEGVSLKDNKKSQVKRRAFTTQEVNNQLNYKFQHGSEAREFRDDARWFVPISIYSGMRLNEISELTTKNVVKIDDVWCFDLIGMEVKNEPSNRIVPIAQYLLDKGILDYVAKLNNKYKNKREVLLFPQIRKKKKQAGKSGWGEPISRWFNRTALENMGIDFDEEKRRKTTVCFHCIRHTFITKMVNAGCQMHHIKRIVGHSVEDDVTLSVYSNVNNIPLALLKSEMDKHLTWHLEAIKN